MLYRHFLLFCSNVKLKACCTTSLSLTASTHHIIKSFIGIIMDILNAQDEGICYSSRTTPVNQSDVKRLEILLGNIDINMLVFVCTLTASDAGIKS